MFNYFKKAAYSIFKTTKQFAQNIINSISNFFGYKTKPAPIAIEVQPEPIIAAPRQEAPKVEVKPEPIVIAPQEAPKIEVQPKAVKVSINNTIKTKSTKDANKASTSSKPIIWLDPKKLKEFQIPRILQKNKKSRKIIPS